MINLISTAEAAVILLVFRCFSFLSEKKRDIIVNMVCLILLSFNICRYTAWSLDAGRLRLPVEFSAISYFLVPLTVLLRIPALRVWAAYSGVLAGGGYFISVAIFGDMVYKNESRSSITAAALCHGALLLIGLFIISERRFSNNSRWIITLGLIYVGFNALLLKSRVGSGNGIFIYELIYAIRPIKLFGMTVFPFYYIFLFVLLLLSFKLFYSVNRKLAKK